MESLNKHRDQFGQEWESAFENAELTPSPQVWDKLDAHLANTANQKAQRKILYYKLLAAASVVFAMTVGLVAYLGTGSSDYHESIAESAPQTTAPLSGTEDQVLPLQPEEAPSQTISPITDGPDVSGSEPPAISEIGGTPGLLAISKDAKDQKADASKTEELLLDAGYGIALETKDHLAYVTISVLDKRSPQYHSDMKLKDDYQIYRKPMDPDYYTKQKDSFEPVFWAGVNMAPGIFNPNFGGSSNDAAAQAQALDATAAQELNMVRDFQSSVNSVVNSGFVDNNADPGVGYSIGFNLGMRLSKRWLLQSGVNYANFNSSAQASVLAEDNNKSAPLYISNLTSEELQGSQLNFTNQFDINSSYEFASVPIKAGYMLVDRKFKLILNGGFSTDFFLNNTISDQDNQFDETTLSSGDDSPFRKVYFSGLAGVELGYNLGRNYTLSLEPNYRLSLNSFTKSSSLFESRPNLFSISLGLRYNFR